MEKLKYIEDQEDMASSMGVDPKRKELMVQAITKIVEKVHNTGGNSIELFIALREVVETKEEAFLAGMLYTSVDNMLRRVLNTDEDEDEDKDEENPDDGPDDTIKDFLSKLFN